jgi:hypothetical protein
MRGHRLTVLNAEGFGVSMRDHLVASGTQLNHQTVEAIPIRLLGEP